MDRHDARVLVKPESSQNISTYRGVIFTRAGSPVESIEDLAGCSIAMVKATTAGDLFPVSMMAQHGMFESGEPVEMRWVGTHDMAIQEVVAGRTNVAAAKDLRLDAYEAAHPVVQLRRLATSESVPSNALLVHASVDETLARRLADILLEMDQHPHGRATLEAFGAQRFVTCSADEYDAIYDMIDVLGENWSRLGVDGPPPRRPGPAVTRGGY
jgi:ABC-type phosphate/phosphonate transport system substrate-binding protein